MNGLGMLTFATFVLFAQENLDLETGLLTGVLRPVAEFFGADSVAAFIFAVLMMSGAIGGVVGSVLAPRVARRMGRGPALYMTIASSGASAAIVGMSTRWWMVFHMFALATFTAVVWNVITVSYRQTIIPDELLGRVNSVYRFFAWGMMPIGAAVGGLIVAAVGVVADRDVALRATWFASAAVHLGLFVFGRSRLTTAKIEAARTAATPAPSESDSGPRK
jgi:MFS family permease